MHAWRHLCGCFKNTPSSLPQQCKRVEASTLEETWQKHNETRHLSQNAEASSFWTTSICQVMDYIANSDEIILIGNVGNMCVGHLWSKGHVTNKEIHRGRESLHKRLQKLDSNKFKWKKTPAILKQPIISHNYVSYLLPVPAASPRTLSPSLHQFAARSRHLCGKSTILYRSAAIVSRIFFSPSTRRSPIWLPRHVDCLPQIAAVCILLEYLISLPM